MVLLPKNAWWDTVSNTTWAEKLPIFHSEDQIEWGGIDLLTRPSGHKHFKNECRRAKTKEAMWIKTLWSWEIPPPLRSVLRVLPSRYASFMAAGGRDSSLQQQLRTITRLPIYFLCSTDLGPFRR